MPRHPALNVLIRQADEGLIPRRLRRYIAVTDTPLLCGGVVHGHLDNSSAKFETKRQNEKF
jgi:hypothetical protein